MTLDARFGLPLSLAEALRADPSPAAAALAELMADEGPPPRPRRARPWRSALAGLGLAAACAAAAPSYAQAATQAATPIAAQVAAPAGLEGRWVMAAQGSAFSESVTGPAPDRVVVVVSRDAPDRLAYELVESRGGREVARSAYDVSFAAGAASRSRASGAELAITGEREPSGDVLLRAPPVGGMRAVIRVRRTGPDSAVLEHAVEGPAGRTPLERVDLVRDRAAAPTPPAVADTGPALASR